MTDVAPLDIRRLKDLARRLPPTSALRKSILVEDDIMQPAEFVCKTKTWVRLLEDGGNADGAGTGV